jgi:tetratricopeptide (TPR) repeat protein
MLGLQAALGNRYVQGLMAQRVQREAAVPDAGAAPAAPTVTTRRTLRQGSRGDEVRELQSSLNARSDVTTPLEVDEIFGPITARAVREVQSANPPLVVDAVVGPLTWGVIDSGPGVTDNTVLAKKVFERGSAAYDRGAFAHAYDFFVRAHELDPRPGILFSQGQALRRLGGRREDAIRCYEEYLATGHGKRDAEAQQHIAELRGPAQTGVAEVDTAAGKALFDRGAQLYEAGDFAHAYDEFTKAGEVSPRPGIVFSRAQALRRLGGRRDETIALYEEYLASGHGKRDAEAQQHIEELRGPAQTGVEEVDSAAAKAIFERGSRFYEAGDFAHAYDKFTKAGEVSPRPGIVFSRAQALRRLGGRRDEAIALYEEYLLTGHGKRDEEARFHIGELRTQGAEP